MKNKKLITNTKKIPQARWVELIRIVVREINDIDNETADERIGEPAWWHKMMEVDEFLRDELTRLGEAL